MSKQSPSELRFDLVSKDWVVIATGRACRPETFAKQKRVKDELPIKDCPFCQPEILDKAILRYNQPDGSWSLIVIPNDFPAFSPKESLRERGEGPYQIMDGVGFHEVIITRDHKKSIAQFSISQTRELIDAYQERYLDLMNERFVNYISIFHNYGREAGASIAHPHSQLIALPVIDPDLNRSLRGSRQFFELHKKCVHCHMLEWDMEDGRRIIFENEKFVVLCPFASRVAFEVRVYPKEHHAYFERIADEEKNQLAEALQVAVNKLYKGMNDPAYNFFIHTAPCDGKNYDHYHWHFEILPKTSIWAGFELGTGIEISTIEPEKAAEFLRKQ
ncbi:MAG: galactose-1-phosphate uridylyltransferase [Candidatus Nealsonbacteria bacterium]|nr:MAG: galactose-1-phosphate uridylyltransferase [Candidatus Nealsonbacteria bacterium]